VYKTLLGLAKTISNQVRCVAGQWYDLMIELELIISSLESLRSIGNTIGTTSV
jgi:tRNA splicing ligase